MAKKDKIIKDFNKQSEKFRNLSAEENSDVTSVDANSKLGTEILKEIERLEDLKKQKKESGKDKSQTGAKKRETSQSVQQKIKDTPVVNKQTEPENLDSKDEKPEAQILEESQEQNESETVATEPQIDAKYAEFLKQYERKKVNPVEASVVGKYDSDLDFQLNRKIKKVRFPMPKGIKALICCLAALLVVVSSVLLAVHLKDDTPQVLLTQMSLSQPKNSLGAYVVNNVYVGDKLNLENIYINCEYSDGSSKQVELERSMLSTTSQNLSSQDIFTQSGEVKFVVTYLKQTINLTYQVQEKTVESVSLFTTSQSDEFDILASGSSLDITNSVVVNAHYSNGQIQSIDLSKCTYTVVGEGLSGSLTYKTISLAGLTSGNIYTVEITYQGQSATFKIKMQ